MHILEQSRVIVEYPRWSSVLVTWDNNTWNFACGVVVVWLEFNEPSILLIGRKFSHHTRAIDWAFNAI
jgi:hypothetical protein